MHAKHILLTALSFICLQAKAQTKKQESPIEKRLEKCLEDSTTTSGMCNCTSQAEEAWDKELNKYYKLLMAQLPAGAKEKLKESQRAWMAWRDKEFAFISEYYYSVKQGTMFYPIAYDRRMEIVRDRAVDLEQYYDMIEY